MWLVLLLTMAAMTEKSAAQRIPCRVVFSDKGPGAFLPGTPTYDSLLATFHPRSLDRRTRIGMSPVLDTLDAPVYAPYLDSIRSISDSILIILPWFNSVTVGLTEAEQEQVRGLPFVTSVVPTSSLSYGLNDPQDCEPPRYGYADRQQSFMGTALLHNAGIYGKSVRVGMIDNGFRWRSMSSLAHLNVEAEYDVIYGDSITANEPIDVRRQDEHGSIILSVIAGWEQDSLIGVAPFGTYLLAKSEDMRYERRIEEELYAAAILWLEKQGADVSSSSLGYRIYDSTETSTPYSALDGKTTYASRAINIAATRGMICVTAAGNDGPAKNTLSTPGDADSAITVGALATDGVSRWPFSSWGPTADGRQKPDFAALGMGAAGQDVSGLFTFSSGTSMATPMVAGQVALLRELYPDVAPWTIREALQVSSLFSGDPDSALGYGSIDAAAAARYLGPGIGPPTIVTVDSKRTVLASVFCDRAVDVKLIIKDPITGQTSTVEGLRSEDPWYLFAIESSQIYRDEMLARVEATVTGSSRRGSFPRDTSWFILPRNAVIKPCGVRLPGSVTTVNDEIAARIEPIVLDHPLSVGTRQIDVAGIDKPLIDVRLVHITMGTVLPCAFSTLDIDRVRVKTSSDLERGAYLIVLRYENSSQTLPIIVR